MYSYKCVFDFGNSMLRRQARSVVCNQDGIYAFAGGFWLTSELKYTKGSDAVYWIPPSQILHVEKIRKEYID